MFFEKKSIKAQVLDYINSQEAIETMATMGASFGHGLMTQLKIGNIGKGQYVKIGGFKIPQAVVDAAVGKIMQRFIGTTKPQEGLGFGTS